MPHPDPSAQRSWERRIAALAARVNTAIWIEKVAPLLFFIASGGAVLLYALRRSGAPLAIGWFVLAAAAAGAGVFVGWRARRSFFDRRDARVLLESGLRLDTRLTAASTGLVRWPGAAADRPVIHWRLRGAFTWFGGSIALVAVALLLPIPRDVAGLRQAGVPPALVEAEAMLDALEDMKIADPQALEELSQRVQELKDRPPEEQYQHSALEAADNLREQVEAAAADLANGLEAASSALDAANEGTSMQEASARMATAASDLRSAAIPANAALLGQLPNSIFDLSALSAEQRAQLARMLQAAAANAGQLGNQGHGQKQAKAGGSGRGGRGGDGKGAGAGEGGEGAGEGQGTGQGTGQGAGRGAGQGMGDGMGVGAGGPGGGGGPAALSFSEKKSNAGDGKLETLSAPPGDADPGDQLGMAKGAPPPADPSAAVGPASGGQVSAVARGGDAVWVNRLTPAERAALKNYFK